MNRRGTPYTVKQAFQGAALLHLAFMNASLVYVVTGEVLRSVNEDFADGGFVGLGDVIWFPRAAIIAYTLALTIGLRLIRDEGQIAAMVERIGKSDDAVIAQGLHAALITRVAFVEATAVLGYLLYVMDGNRLDLYAFPAMALVILLFLRPTKERWRAAFQAASLKYEGVSSDPWPAT